jgi:hypothetical protein
LLLCRDRRKNDQEEREERRKTITGDHDGKILQEFVGTT